MAKKYIIISVLAVLVMIVAVFAWLNASNIREKKMLEKQQEILIKADGKLITKLDMEIIESIGLQAFDAKLDTSDSGPQMHKYTGILLKDALTHLDIDYQFYSRLIARAIDGYTVAFDILEVNEENNIYIAIEKDGQPLGDKNSGGSGPYQIIVKKDTFSQRWCKFLIELELKS